jgi:hypothetical protein
MWHAWDRGQINAKFWLENLQKHLEDQDIHGRIIIISSKRHSVGVAGIHLTQDRDQ